MIRAVIDANVVISGLFWRGLPREVFQAAAQGRYVTLTTEPLLDELRNTLSKQKFVPYLTTLTISIDAVRDPKDRAVLACAVGGKADYIVSGDNDLLVLTVYESIPILNVAQFLEHLSN